MKVIEIKLFFIKIVKFTNVSESTDKESRLTYKKDKGKFELITEQLLIRKQ